MLTASELFVFSLGVQMGLFSTNYNIRVLYSTCVEILAFKLQIIDYSIAKM